MLKVGFMSTSGSRNRHGHWDSIYYRGEYILKYMIKITSNIGGKWRVISPTAHFGMILKAKIKDLNFVQNDVWSVYNTVT